MTVLLAFAFTTGHSTVDRTSPHSTGPLPAVSISAAAPIGKAEADCVKVFAKLPVQLGDLAPRIVHSDSTFVAAWGDPAVVLKCGTPRPAELVGQSAALVIRINDVDWLPHQSGDATEFTAIDRSVYLQVTVPKRQSSDPLAVLSDAVKALSSVCSSQNSQGTVPEAQLCTNRP